MQAQKQAEIVPAAEPAAQKSAEPRVTYLPYMGDDESYGGGRLTVAIPSGILSSRDGTGINGQAYSHH